MEQTEVVMPEVELTEDVMDEVVETVTNNKDYIKYGIGAAVIGGLGYLGYKKLVKPMLDKKKIDAVVVDENMEYVRTMDNETNSIIDEHVDFEEDSEE